jgi:hypothetical protein
MTSKSEKILMACLKVVGVSVEQFNAETGSAVKLVNLNKSTIIDSVNIRLLALQGVKGVVNLITSRYAEKNNIDIDGLKSVKLVIFDGKNVTRFYTAFVMSEKTFKKVNAESVGTLQIKADNNKNKQSLVEKVKTLINPQPILQLADTEPENSRIDSLECKMNRIESMLIALTETKKKK